MTINTGGAAFPVPFSLDPEQGGPVFADCYGNGGMTLRDYFAAKAMQGFASTLRGDAPILFDRLAEDAYRMADAMLKAREKQEPACWAPRFALNLGGSALSFDACRNNLWGDEGVPLYTIPGAKGE